MWYFIWVLGLFVATFFAVMSASWHECSELRSKSPEK